MRSLYIYMYCQKFKENDKNFKLTKYASTKASVIFSWLMYTALEVEFIISRQKCLFNIMINGDNKINTKHDNVSSNYTDNFRFTWCNC